MWIMHAMSSMLVFVVPFAYESYYFGGLPEFLGRFQALLLLWIYFYLDACKGYVEISTSILQHGL